MMEQHDNNHSGSQPMSFTAVLPEQSAGFGQGEGKTHQCKDQTLLIQPYACHPTSSFLFTHSQYFLPMTSSFPSQEKPLLHTLHIATSSSVPAVPFPSVHLHQVPPHFNVQN
jgi:hypothetical protein